MLGWLHTCRVVPVTLLKQMLLSTGQTMQHWIQNNCSRADSFFGLDNIFFWFFFFFVVLCRFEISRLVSWLLLSGRSWRLTPGSWRGSSTVCPAMTRWASPSVEPVGDPLKDVWSMPWASSGTWRWDARKLPILKWLQSKTIFAGAFSEEMWLPSFISFLHSHC